MLSAYCFCLPDVNLWINVNSFRSLYVFTGYEENIINIYYQKRTIAAKNNITNELVELNHKQAP